MAREGGDVTRKLEGSFFLNAARRLRLIAVAALVIVAQPSPAEEGQPAHAVEPKAKAPRPTLVAQTEANPGEIEFSRDGRFALMAYGGALVLDRRSGIVLRSLPPNQNDPSLAIAPGGDRVWSGGQMFSVRDGKPVGEPFDKAPYGRTTLAAFHPSRHELAMYTPAPPDPNRSTWGPNSTYYRFNILVWNFDRREVVARSDTPVRCARLTYSPKGDYIGCGNTILDSKTLAVVATLQARSSEFSRSSAAVVMVTNEGALVRQDLRTGVREVIAGTTQEWLGGALEVQVPRILYSDDSRDFDRYARLGHQMIQQLEVNTTAGADVAFLDDAGGLRVAAIRADGGVYLWEERSKTRKLLPKAFSAARSLRFDPDGTVLAAFVHAKEGLQAMHQPRVMRFWDLRGEFEREPFFNHFVYADTAMAAPHDGHDIVIIHQEEAMALDPATLEVKPFEVGDAPGYRSFSADGRVMAIYDPDNKKLTLGRTGQKKPIAELAGVGSFSLSATGDRVAYANDESSDVTLIDVATRQHVSLEFGPKAKYYKTKYYSLGFTPDGTLFAHTIDYPVSWSADGKLRPRTAAPEIATKEQLRTGPVTSPDLSSMAGGYSVKTVHRTSIFDRAGRVRCDLPDADEADSYAFSRDGKRLATPKAIYDATSCAVLGPGPGGRLHPLAWTADGRFIVARGALFSLHFVANLYDTQKLTTAGSIYMMGKRDAAITTPGGYYRATPAAMSGFGFVAGDQAYRFEQFDLLFNRPDLVLKSLGTASAESVAAIARARRRRLSKLGVAPPEDFDLGAAPALHLVDRDQVPLSTADRELILKIKASSPASTLARLFLTVNGVPIDGAAGRKLKAAREATELVKVVLGRGSNNIDLWVTDRAGTTSLREKLLVSYVGPAAPARRFVATLGVSKYKQAEYDLTYAAKDATDMARTFGGGTAQVLTLTDQEVSKENLAKVREFLAQATVDDEVILFVAGHGLLDDKFDYYFASFDTDFAAPAARAIPYADVEGLLDGVKARKKLLLIDTCHSGDLDKEDAAFAGEAKVKSVVVAQAFRGIKRVASKSAGQTGRVASELFADLDSGTGATVIASSSGSEFALESSEWKGGVFSYAVREGLASKAADLDHDGIVRVSELKAFVIGRVLELTGGLQQPTSRRDNLALDFALTGRPSD